MPTTFPSPTQNRAAAGLDSQKTHIRTLTRAAVSGLTISETQNGAVRQSVITLNAVSVTITRNGTTAVYGGLQLATFPEGVNILLGGVANLTVTRGETTNMTATAPLVVAVGSVTASNNATLSSTEADAVPSSAFTLVAGTKASGGHLATAAIYDGHTTARPVFLNVAGDNTTDQCVATGNSSVTVTGTIVLTWIQLGDYT